MKENQDGTLCDRTNCANDAASLGSEINEKDGMSNTPQIECNMIVEDISNGNENGARDSIYQSDIPASEIKFLDERNLCNDMNGDKKGTSEEHELGESVAPCTVPSGEKELFEKNADLYTDKNVMQCEVPELIVCYRENAYHAVKDICIDEGMPFEDKILIDSENDNKNGSVTKEREDMEMLSPNVSDSSSENYHDGDDDIEEFEAKEKVDMELLLADALKSLLENDFDHGISDGGGSFTLVCTGEKTNHPMMNNVLDDVTGEILLKSGTPLLQKFSQHKSLKSLLGNEFDGDQVEQHDDETPYSEAKCENPGDEFSANSKVERATIALDINDSKSAAISGDNLDDVPSKQPLKIDSSAVGNEIQLGQGESSFSMAGPVSGLITYSGPIASSGSVSLRSESSTTSTRSFAFPVLQAEWNASPVRMAKVDRRQYRKRKGWRNCLLCCKF